MSKSLMTEKQIAKVKKAFKEDRRTVWCVGPEHSFQTASATLKELAEYIEIGCVYRVTSAGKYKCYECLCAKDSLLKTAKPWPEQFRDCKTCKRNPKAKLIDNWRKS